MMRNMPNMNREPRRSPDEIVEGWQRKGTARKAGALGMPAANRMAELSDGDIDDAFAHMEIGGEGDRNERAVRAWDRRMRLQRAGSAGEAAAREFAGLNPEEVDDAIDRVILKDRELVSIRDIQDELARRHANTSALLRDAARRNGDLVTIEEIRRIVK